jgi:hypothetical protein
MVRLVEVLSFSPDAVIGNFVGGVVQPLHNERCYGRHAPAATSVDL